jgi:hypothetical protein
MGCREAPPGGCRLGDRPARAANIPTRFTVRLFDNEGGTHDFSGTLRLTSPILLGRCHIGESYGTFRDTHGHETMGIIEYRVHDMNSATISSSACESGGIGRRSRP